MGWIIRPWKQYARNGWSWQNCWCGEWVSCSLTPSPASSKADIVQETICRCLSLIGGELTPLSWTDWSYSMPEIQTHFTFCLLLKIVGWSNSDTAGFIRENLKKNLVASNWRTSYLIEIFKLVNRICYKILKSSAFLPAVDNWRLL